MKNKTFSLHYIITIWSDNFISPEFICSQNVGLPKIVGGWGSARTCWRKLTALYRLPDSLAASRRDRSIGQEGEGVVGKEGRQGAEKS